MAPGSTFAPVVVSGSGVPSAGSASPPAVVINMLPLACTSVWMSTTCPNCCTAASRWFCRSAVLWPPDCSVTICAFNWLIVLRAVLIVPTSLTMLFCADWRCVV